MQYHVDGFRPGDPDVQPAAPGIRHPGDPLPAAVDVLIAGCGPAGLCLAAQLARHPSIRTLLVEQKPGPIEKGQADGISVRTMEMFQAFGFAERVMREAVWINETTFWAPSAQAPLARVARVPDVPAGFSEMPHVLLNQARVHDSFLQTMRNAPTRLAPDYGLKVVDLRVDTAAREYPVTVWLQRSGGADAGRAEVVRANYVVGCDGARSAVRQAIGGTLRGSAAHQAWGVVDLLAVTDFPDWRRKSFVRSRSGGTLMVLPREGGHLVRLYVELAKLHDNERVAERGLTVEDILAKARHILSPFVLDVKEVVWWSIYEIRQRLTDRFDDVPPQRAATRTPRVLLAGDACHTHSPKAGQGMNVSMGDTFNLGWKLILVLTGRADPALLHTYTAERRATAEALIDFDRQWAQVVGGADDGGGADGLPRVARDFVRNLPFTCGLTVRYAPSALTGAPTHQDLAPGFEIGARFHSAPVIRLADAKPMHLGHCIEADARFRLFLFAPQDDGGEPGGPIAHLCDWLLHDPASPVLRHTAAGEDLDAVIDVRAVFARDLRTLEHPALPPLLRPAVGRYGLTDYEKAFCADPDPSADIYALRGIDRARGCAVIVRPDQYVGHVLPLSARAELSAYFGAILKPQR